MGEEVLVRRRASLGKEVLPLQWVARGLLAQLAVTRCMCLVVSPLFVKVMELKGVVRVVVTRVLVLGAGSCRRLLVVMEVTRWVGVEGLGWCLLVQFFPKGIRRFLLYGRWLGFLIRRLGHRSGGWWKGCCLQNQLLLLLQPPRMLKLLHACMGFMILRLN